MHFYYCLVIYYGVKLNRLEPCDKYLILGLYVQYVEAIVSTMSGVHTLLYVNNLSVCKYQKSLVNDEAATKGYSLPSDCVKLQEFC